MKFILTFTFVLTLIFWVALWLLSWLWRVIRKPAKKASLGRRLLQHALLALAVAVLVLPLLLGFMGSRLVGTRHDEAAYNGPRITLDGTDIYGKQMDVVALRARVGIVFQKPNPFPKSIFDNVAYGPRLHGLAGDRAELEELVHKSLERAGLLEEVKDRLEQPGTGLSGGQQQRLCIARAIAVNPEVILMDEPCSALDPIATARIEDLIDELRENYTIVIVTHSMQQAARVSQRTAYFHLGNLIEVGETDRVFTNPRHKLTEDYITGRFG